MKILSFFCRITLILPILMSGSLIWAQNTNWAFHAPGIGGNSPTSPLVENCVDRDLQGNIIVASTTVDSIQFGPFAFAGFQPFPPNPLFTENAYFSKLNFSGGVYWVSKIEASVLSRIYDLKVDQAGNIFVIGNVIGDATFDTVTVLDAEELFLAKYGTDGHLKWVTLTESPPTTTQRPQGRALAIGEDGNVYISGFMSKLSNFQNIQLDVGSESHFFMAKYSTDGIVQWARGYGLTSPIAQKIGADLDGDNNIYLTGTTVGVSAFDTITVDANGMGTFFLARFNDDGNIAWIDLIKNNDVNSSRLVLNRQFNQIYVTGYFSFETVSFGNFTLTAPVYPGRTFFLAKYDADKNILWAKANGGDVKVVRGKSIDISPDGSVFISGDYGDASQTGVGVVFGEGTNAVTLKKKGTYDGFMVKYKSDGTVDWGKAFSGPENDDAKAVCAYSNEIGVVTGIMVDSIYIGDTAFFSKPVDYAGNFYLASCDGSSAPSWIFDSHAENAGFQLFPNPASGHVSVVLDDWNPGEVIVNIFNANGQLVNNTTASTGRIQLDISTLPSGLYFVYLMDDNAKPLGSRKLLVK